MHLKQIEEARALASPVGWTVAAVDKSPAFVVQYVPQNGSGGALATCVVVTATGITLDVDGAVIVDGTADSCGTDGDGAFLFANYATIGALVDGINASTGGCFRAYVAACLRAQATDDLLLAIDASCIGDNGMTVYFDTSANNDATMVISGEKFVNNGPNGWMKDKYSVCENYLISASLTAGFASAGAGSVTIHSCPQNGDGTELYTAIMASATAFALAGTPDVPFMRSTTGERLVIILEDDSTGAVTAMYGTMAGKTAVLRNTHIVTEKNY